MSISLKAWFGSKSTELCILEEHHNTTTPVAIYIFDVALKNETFPFPLDAKDQNIILWGLGKRQLFSIFKRPLA